MSTNPLKTQKVTIYFRGEMFSNYHKIEATAHAVRLVKYAQYSSAVEFTFIPKGARKARGTVQTYQPSLLILEGWNHPDPATMFSDPESRGDVTVQRSRHASCAPEWDSEFNTLIESHITATGAKVVADFRGHDPYSQIPAVSPCEHECDGCAACSNHDGPCREIHGPAV